MKKQTLFTQDLITPIGCISIRGTDTHLYSITLEKKQPTLNTAIMVEKAKQQLSEYFMGKRKTFDLVLHQEGTDFQRWVWDQTQKTPYGTTQTYGQIHKGAQAVGSALNKNKHLIVVPCHRVVAKKGLGGFYEALWVKEYLLSLEKSI